MATAQDLLKASLRKIGVIAVGETPTDTELQDALDDMNRMLKLWATKQILLYASTSESFALVAGTVSYTMGAAGTASTVRANKILNAFVRDSDNYDHSIEIITEDQYNGISDKTTQGRPFQLFYDPTYAVGTIYFYYTPDSAETVYIESLKTLHTAFTELTTTVSLPGEYEEAIVYNLALRLHSEYPDIPISPALAKFAEDSLNAIIILNAAKQIGPVRLDPGIAGGGRPYNINVDD